MTVCYLFHVLRLDVIVTSSFSLNQVEQEC